MMILVRWLLHALILLAAVRLGQAIGLALKLEGFADACVVVFLLALANAASGIVVNTLFKVVNCLTFGIFGFIVSIIVIILVDIAVAGFTLGEAPLQIIVSAVYLSLATGLLGGIVNMMLKPRKKEAED